MEVLCFDTQFISWFIDILVNEGIYINGLGRVKPSSHSYSTSQKFLIDLAVETTVLRNSPVPFGHV